MNGHIDRSLEAILGALPTPGFKARLWADLERKIAMTATAVVRPGFRNLTIYLRVPDVDRMLDFYTAAFGAETTFRTGAPNGVHSELRIGDSMLMMGGPVQDSPTACHLYVDDLEGTYHRALDAGAKSTLPLTQAPYGERFGAIVDPAGNHWYIAERATSKIVHSEMGSVTPYLHPVGAPDFIGFLKQAFGADQLERYDEEGRGVAHCKMRIAESVLELGESNEMAPPMPTSFYLSVGDVDAVYRQALAAGATSIHEPTMQPYGDFMGAVEDRWGNRWHIAKPQQGQPSAG